MKHNSNIYPTMPFDSERILAYRQRCQKPRELEEIWSWFVLRRVSIYVTLWLRRTRITPNGVSWLSIFCFILTGWLIVLAEPWSYVVAVITYNIGYMCDCVDGELARLNNVTSRRGVFLDTLIRACSIPIVAALMLSLFGWSHSAVIGASLLYATVVLATMALLVPLAYHLTYSETEADDPVGNMRTQSRRAEWLAFFLGLPGFFAVLPVSVTVEALFAIPFNTWFFAVFLILFSMKTLARLYITYNRIK